MCSYVFSPRDHVCITYIYTCISATGDGAGGGNGSHANVFYRRKCAMAIPANRDGINTGLLPLVSGYNVTS